MIDDCAMESMEYSHSRAEIALIETITSYPDVKKPFIFIMNEVVPVLAVPNTAA
jgi:hypothetical protein